MTTPVTPRSYARPFRRARPFTALIRASRARGGHEPCRPLRASRDRSRRDFLDAARRDEAGAGGSDASLPTELYCDPTRRILSHNDSPDVGFDTSLNPYRGCEHGCAYCFARPRHEWLGLSAGLDFERKIFVKMEAPALLRRELEKRSWRPHTIAIAGVTDAYQPIERRLRITRGCLEVLVELRNPVTIVSGNELVARDRDLLGDPPRHDAASIVLSVTTLEAISSTTGSCATTRSAATR